MTKLANRDCSSATAPRSNAGERVLVAMSGGVDSAVAAGLLLEQGYDVFGVTLHLWDAPENQRIGRCCAPEDREDARRVCDHLGIAHYVFDERAAFRAQVVEPLLDDYLAGETPSPCVHCNKSVKLEALVSMADALGAAYVATGHYVQIRREPSEPSLVATTGPSTIRLFRGRDANKDQSYFLFGASVRTLSRLLTPLGGLEKSESRAHAKRMGLPNADKGDSQELCFIPDGDVAGFIRKERGEDALRPGVIRDESGEVLGGHAGAAPFTVGQRRGLRIGGGEARYVLRVLPAQNEVLVGGSASLMSRVAYLRDVQWMAGWVAETQAKALSSYESFHDKSFPSEPLRARVRIRYRHEPAWAKLVPGHHVPKQEVFDRPSGQRDPGEHDPGEHDPAQHDPPTGQVPTGQEATFVRLDAQGEGLWTVFFEEEQRAVTPGQAAVLYNDEDEVLGGGFVTPGPDSFEARQEQGPSPFDRSCWVSDVSSTEDAAQTPVRPATHPRPEELCL